MSRRGTADQLPVGHQLLNGLPGLYHDDFTRRFTAAFDQVLAPIFATLDCLDSYLDPDLAPVDLLTWIGNWLAIADVFPHSVDRRRRLVANAVDLYSRRGTAHGIRALLALCADSPPEIVESGGTHWSTEPDAAPSGTDTPALIIRVPPATDLDLDTLTALVTATIPAHVQVRIEAHT